MEDMGVALATALTQMADPFRIMMLVCGVLLGLVLGIIPGLGGLVGLTLLLPFTFSMDPYTALAILIGMHAVVSTSDSIPAILFGVPGTVGSAATILDGYPMAKRGEAGRALGAAFTASLLGGLFGALLLAIFIPLLRPFMLSIGSAEMLAFCVFGLSLAAALSGKHVLRGLAVAALGVMLAMVGEDYQSGTMRWTFGTLYLWEGIPLVPFALGLFALPEIADLVVRRTTISGEISTSTQGRMQGMRDVLRNPIVLLRSSAIGSILGALPGLGSAVIDWIAYGSAAKTKDPSAQFGNGDVRGVIASEAANNAKEGGALVPTIAFGVPGSAGMAILLGAFLVQGIVPGPEMLSSKLDITYTLILSLAAANIVGAGLCFFFAPHLARVAMIPVGYLAPIVLGIVFIGALQAEHHWGDLIVLVTAGALGYLMRLLHWPRPPLLLGFVLGALIERYLATSVQIYGFDFLSRPVVAIVLILTIWGIAAPLLGGLWRRLQGQASEKKVTFGFNKSRLGWDPAFALVLAAFFAVVLVNIDGWPRGARLIPQFVGWTGILITLAYVAGRLFSKVVATDDIAHATAGHMDLAVDKGDLGSREFTLRGVMYFVWTLGYGALAFVIGPLLATPLWVAIYMIVGWGIHWIRAIATALVLGAIAWLIFERLLNVPWPTPLLRF